jgi:hypothetical protein
VDAKDALNCELEGDGHELAQRVQELEDMLRDERSGTPHFIFCGCLAHTTTAAQLRAEASAGMAAEAARLVSEAAAEKNAAASVRKQLEDSKAAWAQERARLLKECEVRDAHITKTVIGNRADDAVQALRNELASERQEVEALKRWVGAQQEESTVKIDRMQRTLQSTEKAPFLSFRSRSLLMRCDRPSSRWTTRCPASLPT